MMLDQELGFIYPILPVYKHSSPIYDPCGSVTVSFASRVAAQKLARLGGGRREWLFPCQVLQHRMARFCAQPEGPGPFFFCLLFFFSSFFFLSHTPSLSSSS